MSNAAVMSRLLSSSHRGSGSLNMRALPFGTYRPVEGVHAGLILPVGSLTAQPLTGTQTSWPTIANNDVAGIFSVGAAVTTARIDGSRLTGATGSTGSHGVVSVNTTNSHAGNVLTVADSLIEITPAYGANLQEQLNGIHGDGYTCLRCVIRYGVDNFRVQGGGTVGLYGCIAERTFSWQPDPDHPVTTAEPSHFTHNDGIQVLEGSLIAVGNYLTNLPWQVTGGVVPTDVNSNPVLGGYQNPVITISQLSSGSGLGNQTIDRNYLDGGGSSANPTGPSAPSMQILDSPRTGFPLAPTFTITGNTFGQSGPLAKGNVGANQEVAFRIRGDLTGVTLVIAGNVWADGSPARYEIQNQAGGNKVSVFTTADQTRTY